MLPQDVLTGDSSPLIYSSSPSTPRSDFPASSSRSRCQSPPPPPRSREPDQALSPRSPIPRPRSAAKSPASAPPRLPALRAAPALHHRRFPPADRRSAHKESPH